EAPARLAALITQQGVSLLELTVAAFQVVLARYTGQEVVAVTASAPGGGHPVVLRSRAAASISFLQFLLQVRATATAALAHSDIPFDDLVEQLGLRAELTRAAVVCEASALPFTADVQVRLVEQAAELSGVVEYRSDLFDATTIGRMAGHLVQVLEAVAADPTLPLGRIDILSEEERHQVLVAWNDTGRDVAPLGLAELFEAQVARTPDARAVVLGDEHLSYAELTEAANRLAHHL